MFPRKNLVGPATEGLCESWKFSFEANNTGTGTTPPWCTSFVRQYVESHRCLDDSYVVAEYSYEFALTVNVTSDGKDAWIFDVDETLLSNINFFEERGFGSEGLNKRKLYEWAREGAARALPASLRPYEQLQKLGFKLILLTGRSESIGDLTEQSLLEAGYSNWEKLILRRSSDQDKTTIAYKSEKKAELVEQSYKLHGNSRDQWGDLSGYTLAT